MSYVLGVDKYVRAWYNMNMGTQPDPAQFYVSPKFAVKNEEA